jgi:hypothetical protein
MTTLPRDNDDNAIQALRLRPNGAHSISATLSSSRNATAFNNETHVVSLYTTGPVYIAFGGSNVTASASDHYFPAGLYYDFAIGGHKTFHNTHIAVMAADSACDVYISEKY